MAQDFIIKKGHSSNLKLIAQEDLVENGWYLCVDTAEIYVALRQLDGLLELKKLNEVNIDDIDLASFETRLQALEADHTHVYGYRKDFPVYGERDHMYVAEDEHRTYIFAHNRYIHIADSFESVDDDNDPYTPATKIIYGGSAD